MNRRIRVIAATSGLVSLHAPRGERERYAYALAARFARWLITDEDSRLSWELAPVMAALSRGEAAERLICELAGLVCDPQTEADVAASAIDVLDLLAPVGELADRLLSA